MPWRQRKNEYCSKKCSLTNSEVIEKRKKTNLEKFGTEFYYQSKDFKEKRRKSLNEHYGVDEPLKSPEIMKQLKERNKKKYGVEFYNQTDEFKDKRRTTWISKYGVENPMLSKECMGKRDQTCISRYGHRSSQSASRWNTILSLKDFVIPMFNEEDLTADKEKKYRWKCARCGEEFEQKFGFSNYLNDEGFHQPIPRCLKCFPIVNGVSYKEKEVLSFVKEMYEDEIKENDRTIIHPYEIDIYIPKLKLAIEFDGSYWHQEGVNRPIGYHRMKDELCRKAGIEVFHIKEKDWDEDKEKIKSILKELIG